MEIWMNHQISSYSQKKFKKCKISFHSEMLSCENNKCGLWMCKKTCLPKRYVASTEFYCSKKCKEQENDM